MTNQKALNGTGHDRPHYDYELMKDVKWLAGSIVVGGLAAFSPLLYGGYGLNWLTFVAGLTFVLAVWIGRCKVEGIAYCMQMRYNRRRGRRWLVRRSKAAQTA